MSTKLFFIPILVFFYSFTLPSSVEAKRLLPQAQSQKTDVKTGKNPSRGVTTSVKFRDDRKAIIVNFTNLSVASSVSYILSYNTRGTQQAAGGSITLPTSEPVTRELLFGTCSKGVCRYDTGITNAKFVVTTVLKSGLKVIKTFKLKI